MWFKLINCPELKEFEISKREQLIKEYYSWTFRFLAMRRLLPSLFSILIAVVQRLVHRNLLLVNLQRRHKKSDTHLF